MFSLPQKRSHSSQPPGILPAVPKSAFPKSASISIFMKARKLVKPPDVKELNLTLEKFDIAESKWDICGTKVFHIDKKQFSEGGFRKAYMATCKGAKWVLKIYKDEAVSAIKDTLYLSLESHARKQVQMHMVANAIALKLAKKAPVTYGKTFCYNNVFFSKDKEVPMTLEEFIPRVFTKYCNNTGAFGKACKADDEEIYMKAESLCHFSYHESGNELMMFDLQGSGFQLYDQEVATVNLTDADDDETFFVLAT